MLIPALREHSVVHSGGWRRGASGAVHINTNRWPTRVGAPPAWRGGGGASHPLRRLFRPKKKPLIRASGNPDTVINDDGCNDGTLTRKPIRHGEHLHSAPREGRRGGASKAKERRIINLIDDCMAAGREGNYQHYSYR